MSVRWVVKKGDCRGVLTKIPSDSIDSLVTDPPYGLGFMGAEWDKFGGRGMNPETIAAQKAAELRNEPFGRSGKAAKVAPGEKQAFKEFMREVAWECLRVLKPGAHALVFGGSRTHHWTMDAWEDAGFEIRDTISWWFGVGFPKSMDLPKSIAKTMGVKATGSEPATLGMRNNPNWNDVKTKLVFPPFEEWPPEVQEQAEPWKGFGTAVKPAVEFVMVARKPLPKGFSITKNVMVNGAGALNIDGCRIRNPNPGKQDRSDEEGADGRSGGATSFQMRGGPRGGSDKGRWPTNLILTHHEQCRVTGAKKVKTGKAHRKKGGGNTFGGENSKPAMEDLTYADESGNEEVEVWDCVLGCPVGTLEAQNGGASRFFYCTKPAKKEKLAGVRAGAPEHPTVKPVELLRYLARLVTPRGGVLLDPFAGSGSQGVAAGLEGFDYIGIELDQEGKDFVKTARERIRHWVGDPVRLISRNNHKGAEMPGKKIGWNDESVRGGFDDSKDKQFRGKYGTTYVVRAMTECYQYRTHKINDILDPGDDGEERAFGMNCSQEWDDDAAEGEGDWAGNCGGCDGDYKLSPRFACGLVVVAEIDRRGKVKKVDPDDSVKWWDFGATRYEDIREIQRVLARGKKKRSLKQVELHISCEKGGDKFQKLKVRIADSNDETYTTPAHVEAWKEEGQELLDKGMEGPSASEWKRRLKKKASSKRSEGTRRSATKQAKKKRAKKVSKDEEPEDDDLLDSSDGDEADDEGTGDEGIDALLDELD